MVKKGLIVLVLFAFLSGSLFAQKHLAGDMLLGIDLGMGVTPSISKVGGDSIPSGNYAITFDFGLNFDYYMFKWLSLSSGIFTHAGIYLLWDKPYSLIFLGDDNFTDWAKTPICFTLPIMAHINVPVIEWLYLGAGLTLNFPVSSMLDRDLPGIDTKGDFYLGIPIDLGFDLVKAGKGGSRFFFRVTPEIHKGGTPILIGFMWQIYNFRIYSKKS